MFWNTNIKIQTQIWFRKHKFMKTQIYILLQNTNLDWKRKNEFQNTNLKCQNTNFKFQNTNRILPKNHRDPIPFAIHICSLKNKYEVRNTNIINKTQIYNNTNLQFLYKRKFKIINANYRSKTQISKHKYQNRKYEIKKTNIYMC